MNMKQKTLGDFRALCFRYAAENRRLRKGLKQADIVVGQYTITQKQYARKMLYNLFTPLKKVVGRNESFLLALTLESLFKTSSLKYTWAKLLQYSKISTRTEHSDIPLNHIPSFNYTPNNSNSNSRPKFKSTHSLPYLPLLLTSRTLTSIYHKRMLCGFHLLRNFNNRNKKKHENSPKNPRKVKFNSTFTTPLPQSPKKRRVGCMLMRRALESMAYRVVKAVIEKIKFKSGVSGVGTPRLTPIMTNKNYNGTIATLGSEESPNRPVSANMFSAGIMYKTITNSLLRSFLKIKYCRQSSSSRHRLRLNATPLRVVSPSSTLPLSEFNFTRNSANSTSNTPFYSTSQESSYMRFPGGFTNGFVSTSHSPSGDNSFMRGLADTSTSSNSGGYGLIGKLSNITKELRNIHTAPGAVNENRYADRRDCKPLNPFHEQITYTSNSNRDSLRPPTPSSNRTSLRPPTPTNNSLLKLSRSTPKGVSSPYGYQPSDIHAYIDDIQPVRERLERGGYFGGNENRRSYCPVRNEIGDTPLNKPFRKELRCVKLDSSNFRKM